jgi:Domain of unknown function (DUF4189)
MRLLILLCLLFAAYTPVYAQCRQGSGPDHGDGIPYCSQPSPSSRPSPQPELPPQWQNFSAAVAWGDIDDSDGFVGVEKYFDEQMAREQAMAKCQAKGWANCVVASSTTNGVIIVARDSKQKLRLRIDRSTRDARKNIAEKCESDGVKCNILAVYDGTAEYF